MEPPAVPFFVKVYEGFATASGMARVTADGLTLEFEVRDAMVGMVKSGLQRVQIPYDDVSAVDLRKGWFKTRLFIRTRSMTALSKMPGKHVDAIELGVKRQYRPLAEAMASTAMLRLSQRELEKLGRGPDATTI